MRLGGRLGRGLGGRVMTSASICERGSSAGKCGGGECGEASARGGGGRRENEVSKSELVA